MKEKTEIMLMFFFTVGHLIFFTILSIIEGNYLFLYDVVIISVLIGIIRILHKRDHLNKYTVLGLTILIAMHVFGCNIYISGIRLYDLYFIPGIFKYDNLIHLFGNFIITFVIYDFLHPHLDKKTNQSPFLLSFIIISIAMGIGAYIEIYELTIVLFFGAAKQIGNYLNNALDLLFNLIGSLIACLFIIRCHIRKHRQVSQS